MIKNKELKELFLIRGINLPPEELAKIAGRLAITKDYFGTLYQIEKEYDSYKSKEKVKKEETKDMDLYLYQSNLKKKISCYLKSDGSLVKEFSSLREAARELGGIKHVGNISNVANGKNKSYKGYIWKYTD